MKIRHLYTSTLALCMGALLLFSFKLSAQKHESIEVTANNGISTAPIQNKAYRYPDFQEGKVTFQNGVTTVSKLNYNLFSGQVEFIKGKDTLAIDNIFTITSIAIGNDLFFYDMESSSLLQQLEVYKSSKLLKKEKYEVADIKSKGAMGSQPSSIAATSATQYTDNSQTYNLSSKDSYKFKVKTSYYLSDINDQYYEASKRNVLKLFPNTKEAISQYIKTNNVDFRNENELKALMVYIDGLNQN